MPFFHMPSQPISGAPPTPARPAQAQAPNPAPHPPPLVQSWPNQQAPYPAQGSPTFPAPSQQSSRSSTQLPSTIVSVHQGRALTGWQCVQTSGQCDNCTRSISGAFAYRCIDCPGTFYHSSSPSSHQTNLTLADFDLCTSCVPESPTLTTQTHRPHHRLVPLNRGIVHINHTCDCCHTTIIGTRLVCSICPSSDMCAMCYAQWPHDPSHQFTATDDPAAYIHRANGAPNQNQPTHQNQPAYQVNQGPDPVIAALERQRLLQHQRDIAVMKYKLRAQADAAAIAAI